VASSATNFAYSIILQRVAHVHLTADGWQLEKELTARVTEYTNERQWK